LLGEALEEAAPGPIESMAAVGAPWPRVFPKGYWPQIKPAICSIALLRWDINVRGYSILGLVGAGGIGPVLDSAVNAFQWRAVTAASVAIAAVVLAAECLVTVVRKRIIWPALEIDTQKPLVLGSHPSCRIDMAGDSTSNCVVTKEDLCAGDGLCSRSLLGRSL
jgi:hypothetical protein